MRRHSFSQPLINEQSLTSIWNQNRFLHLSGRFETIESQTTPGMCGEHIQEECEGAYQEWLYVEKPNVK